MTKIKIELTSYCNAKCDFCIHNTLNSFSHINLDKLINFLKLLDDNFKIYISGNRGDPLVYPQLEEALDFIDSKFKRYSITTNGSFNLEKIKFLERYKKLLITFSIDSTLKYDSYRKINAQKSIKNMLYFKNKDINVICKSIIFKYNINEIEKLKKLCKENNIEYDYYESRKYDDFGDLSEPETYTTDGKGYRNYYSCPLNDFLDININSDGFITPCCMITPRTIYDKNIKDINTIEDMNKYFSYYYKKIHPNCIRCKFR